MRFLIRRLLPCILLVCLPTHAQENRVINSLQKDIARAQKALQKTEQQILRESNSLNKDLSKLEKEVLELREQSASLLRAQDENALSLEQLDERLQSWETQSQFQNNLLKRFIFNIKRSTSNTNTNEQESDTNQTQLLAKASNYIQSQQEKSGQFYEAELILTDGREVKAELLALGPLRYFISEQLAGIAQEQNGFTHVLIHFEDEHKHALTQLSEQGFAQLPIDPSNGRAITRLQEQESIASHIEKGGMWAIPILLFAVFALVIASFKFIQVIRLPKLVTNIAMRVEHIWEENSSVEKLNLGPWQKKLVTICQDTSVGQKRDDMLFNALGEQKQKLENFLGAIAITAAVSPLLGLLGTVSGMIETFKLMTLFGAGDPAAVSGGISEALVTTELGLIVAIPALLCHAFLSRKIKSYYHLLEQSAIDLSQLASQSSQQVKLNVVKGPYELA